MSFLNSTLLNGDSFQAGSGASKYLSPVGSVVVTGTLRVTVVRGIQAATECRATAFGQLFMKRELRVVQIAQARHSSFVFDTTHKLFKGNTACALTTDGQLSVKRSLWANRTATVTSRLLATRIKTLAGEQPVQAVGAARLVAYLSLSAAGDNRVGSDSQLSRIMSCYGKSIAAGASSGLLQRMKVLSAAQPVSAFCYANLEERDTRPASDERRMIVPYENRTMEVT